MTTRTMWDAIHNNVPVIPLGAELVAGYVTGTPDIKWTAGDWTRWRGDRHVSIDQGGMGSPVPWANVRDVETGAWHPASAVTLGAGWTAERPTIYCNRDTLPRVLAAGWKGDLWLAIPSSTPPAEPPKVTGCTVVAVQYGFAGSHDLSIVFDPYWPKRGPVSNGIMYAAPTGLQPTATVSVRWNAVPPQDGKPPADYTVVALGTDGHEYFRTVTADTFCTLTNLALGWVYNVRVWANGGDVAPPHASITVHT